ncbi:hypothetical protein BDM02DRAFT_3089587 [Thelephora ganbajun]|uniref:Uncharacterized protein n=1 Tax=Thelephora ganbajun TaxID=370292 RepID=A0ACB6ZRM2_THEGA|nr:hypothetical protein BDM02DRAFT_3089587 [Thelephora ganbajun]
MAPRKACLVCGSRQWHRAPGTGYVTCSEGHVLENYRTEARILDEFGPHTLRKRTLKSGRKKKERKNNADPRLYHGDRARYHYFQCLQLMLRHQIKALTELWKLPPEFEIVCRDIWALHLSTIPYVISAEPLLHKQDGEPHSSPPIRRSPERELVESGRSQDVKGEGSDSESTGSSSSEEEEDPELEALLEQLSASSEDDDLYSSSAPIKQTQQTHKARGVYELPANNIAVLILACWTLRIPITFRDFTKIIDLYDLPYLNVVMLIPSEMRLHLTKHNVQALSSHFPPKTKLLHALSSRLAKRIFVNYRILTPEANVAPILWRAVRALAGSAVLYNMSKKLAQILSLPLVLHNISAPRLKGLKQNVHKSDNVPPEVALISTAIVVLRLVYGLDGRTRIPSHSGDPAYAFPKLDEYMALLRQLNEEDDRSIDNVLSSSTVMHVQELSKDELDEFLDFCAEKALVNIRDGNGERRARLARQQTHQMPQLPAQDPVEPALTEGTTTTILRPGESYKIYYAHDILGSVSEEYALVVERAARWCGVGDEVIYTVVERFERRFLRWKKKDKLEKDLVESVEGSEEVEE